MPLSDVGSVYVAAFTVFIAFFVFAILNVVTAVFCQSALESAHYDKELMTLNLLKEQDQLCKKLTDLFEDIDLDESGFITMDELEGFLMKRHAQAYLQSLGIDTSDAAALLRILADKTGSIDLQDFVSGCLTLRGDAKAIHVATLSYDQQISLQMMEDIKDLVGNRGDSWVGA